MENYFAINTDEKAKEFGQVIINAVIKIHTIEKRCQELIKEIDTVKVSGDKDTIVCILQKYIQYYKPILEYRNMIRLYTISKSEYDIIKVEDWNVQLDMMKSFIYGYQVQKSYENETIKLLKKILSHNEKFTKNKIDTIQLEINSIKVIFLKGNWKITRIMAKNILFNGQIMV